MARKTSEEEKVEKARRLHGELGYSIKGAAREAGLTRSKAAYHLRGQRRGPEPSGEEVGACCPAVLKVVTQTAKDVKHNVKAIDHMAEDISEPKWKAKEEERPLSEHAEKGNVKSEPSAQPSAVNILVTGEPETPEFVLGHMERNAISEQLSRAVSRQDLEIGLGYANLAATNRVGREVEGWVGSFRIGPHALPSKPPGPKSAREWHSLTGRSLQLTKSQTA